jgi:hypothetical protein
MLGHMITFVKTDRHHSGVYTCTAENSEGSPAKGVINLEVTCKFFVFSLLDDLFSFHHWPRHVVLRDLTFILFFFYFFGVNGGGHKLSVEINDDR